VWIAPESSLRRFVNIVAAHDRRAAIRIRKNRRRRGASCADIGNKRVFLRQVGSAPHRAVMTLYEDISLRARNDTARGERPWALPGDAAHRS
jgi:hypothetical protein